MFLKIKNQLFKALRLPRIEQLKTSSYLDELNRQSLKFVPFVCVIFLFVWLPYLSTDKILHPYFFSWVKKLRIGLSVAGVTSLFLFFTLPLKKRTGIVILYAQGIYLVLTTAIITGLSGGIEVYFGGFLFIIMCLTIIPIPYFLLWALVLSSMVVFRISAHIAKTQFESAKIQYGFSDLISASIAAMAFTFLVDKIRKKSYLKSQELEKERNFLKEQKEVLEEELNMAKSIQENLLPSEAPNHSIAFFYKPMAQLGGDFFDFITFPDSTNIGIFLSDVSGHGVPAAFITSMLKSFLLKAGTTLYYPARLMAYLNENLYQQTSGNFITAFYGIYNKDRNTISYCNAGHNLPFLVEENLISCFSEKNKGLPLAIFNNADLQDFNKKYRNEKISIPQKSRMIFYTDGLVETVNIQKPEEEDFGIQCLPSLLKTSFNNTPADCLSLIYEKLLNFRGQTELEDDVCVICLDA